MSNPIPDRLFADLRKAPLVEPWEIRRYAAMSHRPMTLQMRYTLLLVASGLTNRQIGEELHIGTETARIRVRRLLSIYGARNRTHLAAIAIRRGDV